MAYDDSDSEELSREEFEVWDLVKKRVQVGLDDGDALVMTYGENKSGKYIGNESTTRWLVEEKGIVPEVISDNHKVCSIGFNKDEQKWYGWSHRAINGFGIGYISKEDDLPTTSGWTREYLDKEHGGVCPHKIPIGFEVKTLDDAKLVAIAMARSVA